MNELECAAKVVASVRGTVALTNAAASDPSVAVEDAPEAVRSSEVLGSAGECCGRVEVTLIAAWTARAR